MAPGMGWKKPRPKLLIILQRRAPRFTLGLPVIPWLTANVGIGTVSTLDSLGSVEQCGEGLHEPGISDWLPFSSFDSSSGYLVPASLISLTCLSESFSMPFLKFSSLILQLTLAWIPPFSCSLLSLPQLQTFSETPEAGPCLPWHRRHHTYSCSEPPIFWRCSSHRRAQVWCIIVHFPFGIGQGQHCCG